MEPHVERMLIEHKELKEKVEKLDAFIGTNPIFKRLSEEEQRDMRLQFRAMMIYLDVLMTRIRRACPKAEIESFISER